MAVNLPFQSDGDAAFYKVDTRRPAHELEPGVCADAVNKRFEDGRAWPRYSVNLQAWGKPGVWGANLVPGAATFNDSHNYTLTGLTVGKRYLFTQGGTDVGGLINGLDSVNFSAGQSVEFVAKATQVTWFNPSVGVAVGSTVKPFRGGRPCAYARWSDPNGTDNLILVTDDWRDGAGEDGGRGRAWRIFAGQGPIAIPLNGHDVESYPDGAPARLVPCNGGLVLIRQGNERHYFSASAANTVTTQIQLNATPNWSNGERVFFWADLSVGSAIVGSAAPNASTEYFIKNISGNKVELYTDPALSTKLNAWSAAVGRFYIERRSDAPGFFGNGYPPLIMQPLAGGTPALAAGFRSVPVNVEVTAYDGTSKTLTAPNHRLIPGEKVIFVHSGTPDATAHYAYPLNDNQLRFSLTSVEALSGANPQTITFSAGDYLYRDSASGHPMPPAREGIFTKNNRLALVNGRNKLAVSDPNDPLHFTPFQATVTADGDAEPVTALVEIGEDAVLIAKTNKLQILRNFSAGPSGWGRGGVTGEFGIIAPLTAIEVGQDVWGLSRKGVASVRQTEQGEIYGVALPMSQEMKKYIDRIDWSEAPNACAAFWNNRVFFAAPAKGQPLGNKRNNMVLVYNTLNQGWEGVWQGDSLQVHSFSRGLVFGEERLTFVNYDGEACWFGEAFTDASGAAITDSLSTRIYAGGQGDAQSPKLWLKGYLVWDTNNPKLTVTAKTPGHGEQQVCIGQLEYAATKYNNYGQADYDPNTATAADFDRPNRQDYSLTPGEVTIGEADAHQNTTEAIRMRLNDWGVQLVIENAKGSARIQAVNVGYVQSLKTASRQT